MIYFLSAKGKTLDATQEIVTLGVCNIISAFFRSYPVNGSFTRSAVSDASGVRTPAAGFYTGIYGFFISIYSVFICYNLLVYVENIVPTSAITLSYCKKRFFIEEDEETFSNDNIMPEINVY